MHRWIFTRTLIGAALLAASVASVLAGPVRLRPSPTPLYDGGAGFALRAPEGVACAEDTLVVADGGNGRLIRFSVAGDDLNPVQVVQIPEIPYPVGVQIAGDGSLWVLDGRSHRLGRVMPDGSFGGRLGLAEEQGRSMVPKAFRLGPDDSFWILDVRGRRVRVYGAAGTEAREIAFPESLRFASDLAVDASGAVFVLDSVGHRVYSAGQAEDTLEPISADLSEDLAFATNITLDERGNLYLADQNGGGVVVLGRDGSFGGRQATWGWKSGMLRYPAGLCVLNGRLVVADRGNNRVQIFTILE
jgi:sugar lactone lactonase YvrE